MALSEQQRYSWQGTDSLGNRRRGEINANTKQLAQHKLAKMGMRNARLKRQSGDFARAFGDRVKAAHIAVFTRQLATMMRAGIPLVQALDIVIQGLEQRGLKTMTSAIRSDIAAGNRLASSLRRYPQAFDELYCNLVEVGENSGALEEMLDRLATFREKSAALRSKVRKAMYYPMAIVAVAVLVTGILLVKMVPTLAQTFAGFGAELPAFTQFVIGLSDWVIETWWICLASAALFALLAPRALRASRRLRRGLDRVMLALPIFGKIARTSCHARFARTLATTYAAGVPLVEALHSVAGATGNAVYEDATHDIATAVSGGQPLHKSIKDTALFPSMLVQMSSIGEESGSLDSLLERSASYFEDQVEEAVESLTSLLEPAIIVVIGTIVGGLVIAMYLPIFQLGSII